LKLFLRYIYHTAFWGAFTLIFIYQTPNPSIEDWIGWIITLANTAVIVYANLFILLPYFALKRKYITYFSLLVLLIFLGALILPFSVPEEDNYVQNMINYSSLIVISSSLKFFREFLKKQELLIKQESEQLKTELSLLKSQVNPHFLFNTLNNLYGLILQNENPKAAEITLKLSDLMRYILESSKTEKVSLKKEIQFLEDYLALEKIRLSQQADICLEFSGIENDVFVAPMLFTPLIENAFKHGLQSISENNFAHFSLSLQGNELFFEAQNSVGKNPQNQAKSGTGLENLRKRLELMYPEKHFLEIEVEKNAFKVILHLNL
jgi:sensor histidine kinase YesM